MYKKYREIAVNFLEKLPFSTFLLIWTILNLWQAGLTDLSHDEAYYRLYALRLDWGYFDHPPMIALFVRMGLWLGGALGVRLMSVFAQVGCLFLLHEIVKNNQKTLGIGSEIAFRLAVLSIPLFQVFGFIATPDSPLLLFGALFLWAYQRFLGSSSFKNATILGISMAFLLWSKYHGLLFIVFAASANWRILLRNIWSYWAILVGILLFSPHLFWQFHNNFPTFSYHLSERVSTFEWSYVPEYFLNTFLLFNPLIWFILLPILSNFIVKKDKKTESYWGGGNLIGLASVWVILGFFIFFLYSTRRGHVQPQWSVLISLPIILILSQIDMKKQGNRLKNAAFIGFLLLILIRFVLIFDVLPIKNEYHGNKEFCEKIYENSEGRPVIFQSSYQQAAIFDFYHQKLNKNRRPYDDISTHNARVLIGRKTQFDIWNISEKLDGKPIFYVSQAAFGDPNRKEIKLKNGEIFYMYPLKKYMALDKLDCEIEKISHNDEQKQYIFEIYIDNKKNEQLDYLDKLKDGSLTFQVLGYKNGEKNPSQMLDLKTKHITEISKNRNLLTASIPDSLIHSPDLRTFEAQTYVVQQQLIQHHVSKKVSLFVN